MASTLFSWDFRLHDWRDRAIHVILVAQQTVLARHSAGVAGLAEILFHRTEIGSEVLRIALHVALQIRPALFKVMAGQTTAILRCRMPKCLTDESSEASLFALYRSGRN